MVAQITNVYRFKKLKALFNGVALLIMAVSMVV